MTRKIRLEPAEFTMLRGFFQREKTAFSQNYFNQVKQNRMYYIGLLGRKYGFNGSKIRVFSDGIIEVE